MNQKTEQPCNYCGKIITISNKNRYCVKCLTTDTIGPMQFELEDFDNFYMKSIQNRRKYNIKK
jgi:hypothetical protein